MGAPQRSRWRNGDKPDACLAPHHVVERGRVQRLLDGVIDYLPSPMDVPAIQGHDLKDPTKILERHPNPDEPFAGLAFKIVNDQHGDLTYVRVYSGRLPKGSAHGLVLFHCRSVSGVGPHPTEDEHT